MPVVDLTAPVAPPPGLLEGLPRRVALTLPELQHAARLAGDAPLPFGTTPSAGSDSLEDRLGRGRTTGPDETYAAALAGLPDPADTLARRGLVGPQGLDPGLAGALGVLATPRLALDLDVAVEGAQARAWHRQRGEAVAALATADGLLFELAWLTTAQWCDELVRVAALPGDVTAGQSAVPDHVVLPFELADAALTALDTGRVELLPTLLARSPGPVTDGGGRPLAVAEALGALTALAGEARGRLRALVAEVHHPRRTPVAVASWLLLADGWHALETMTPADGPASVTVRRVAAADLPAALAPLLSEVSG